MLIKRATGNIRRIVLIVAIFSFTGTAIVLTVKQHCECLLCEFVGQPPVPCHCTSLASYYLRRALGRNDSYFDSTNHRIENRAGKSQSQEPCSVGRVAHP